VAKLAINTAGFANRSTASHEVFDNSARELHRTVPFDRFN
jgi:hypothetical protein